MTLKHGLTICASIVILTATLVAESSLPDLAQLKLSAESGDRVAQYDYARKAGGASEVERFGWYLKSAEQGYAPAQDTIAELLSTRYIPDSKKKRASDREAVRWASRAAYQGLPSAQSRISQSYARGVGIAADPLKAYTWAQIAVNSSGGDQGKIGGLMYKVNRDVLNPKIPSVVIAEGQRLAADFKPTQYDRLNPIEADLVFGELRLSAIYEIKDHKSAVVNSVRFISSETKPIEIDQKPVELTCIAIEGKVARFAIAGTNYQIRLTLQH